MNVPVKPVKAMDSSLERPEKTIVKVLSPVGGQDDIRGCSQGQTMSGMVHFRVADVPALFHR
jgi:hypothetical protein